MLQEGYADVMVEWCGHMIRQPGVLETKTRLHLGVLHQSLTGAKACRYEARSDGQDSAVWESRDFKACR